jgi:NADH:ubiquinone oxidoreductase subunit 5 (subunit L)/multisubunit Na+/H+ antiporter MnhA subunit
MLEQWALLVPFLPWLAAAWIGLGFLSGRNRGEAGERETAWTAQGAVLLALGILLALAARGAPGQVEGFLWLESGGFRIRTTLALDGLGLGMGILVALIAFLTLRFSVNYMHREAGFQRFFAILCLFAGAMLLIVLAGNAVLAFIGWEVAGLASYLLIAYAHDRPTATANATRAFVTNRFGDAGFIVAIAMSIFWLHALDWPGMERAAEHLGSLAAGVVGGGFVLAALAKSAQMPFAAWIGRALEGPTPSSAVFYGSLMVHAGVFLILRIEPVVSRSPALMLVLVVLGLLTAIYGLVVGLVQTDVKSALIFSTQAQVGLMFAECGLGLFDLAAWHMALHASWRAWQFLSAPAYMHMADGAARPVPRWLGRSRRVYTAALQRFWLDPVADALLVRTTQRLGRDVQTFDEQMVDRVIGRAGAPRDFLHAHGIFGRALERLAEALHWFEVRLVLSSGGEGLTRGLRHLGAYLILADRLLGQPRYLLLLIVITFIVIL